MVVDKLARFLAARELIAMELLFVIRRSAHRAVITSGAIPRHDQNGSADCGAEGAEGTGGTGFGGADPRPAARSAATSARHAGQ